MRALWIPFLIAGCSKSDPKPTAGSGSAPAPADAAVKVAEPVDAAAAPAPAKQADCLPAEDPDVAVGYALGRAGGQLVVCAGSGTGIVGCWGVDAKTGKLAARTAAPIPGVGFQLDLEKAAKPNCYQDLCWTAAPSDSADDSGFAYAAYHPDGKRAAILAGMQVTIFDLATKQPIKSFPLRKDGSTVGDNEISNSPGGLWFAGEVVYVRGNDAGPASYLFPYTVDGKATGMYSGLYHGDVAVDDGKVLINEDALATLTILDGKAKKVVRRKIPKGPCKPDDNPEWSDMGDGSDPKQDACNQYITKHYSPYDGVAVLADGAGFVALGGKQLIQLDGKLAETGKVALATCK